MRVASRNFVPRVLLGIYSICIFTAVLRFNIASNKDASLSPVLSCCQWKWKKKNYVWSFENEIAVKVLNESYFGIFIFFGFQEGIEPLPVEDVNKVWEHMRDYGILVGKGGIFGNVRRSFWSFKSIV